MVGGSSFSSSALRATPATTPGFGRVAMFSPSKLALEEERRLETRSTSRSTCSAILVGVALLLLAFLSASFMPPARQEPPSLDPTAPRRARSCADYARQMASLEALTTELEGNAAQLITRRATLSADLMTTAMKPLTESLSSAEVLAQWLSGELAGVAAASRSLQGFVEPAVLTQEIATARTEVEALRAALARGRGAPPAGTWQAELAGELQTARKRVAEAEQAATGWGAKLTAVLSGSWSQLAHSLATTVSRVVTSSLDEGRSLPKAGKVKASDVDAALAHRLNFLALDEAIPPAVTEAGARDIAAVRGGALPVPWSLLGEGEPLLQVLCTHRLRHSGLLAAACAASRLVQPRSRVWTSPPLLPTMLSNPSALRSAAEARHSLCLGHSFVAPFLPGTDQLDPTELLAPLAVPSTADWVSEHADHGSLGRADSGAGLFPDLFAPSADGGAWGGVKPPGACVALPLNESAGQPASVTVVLAQSAKRVTHVGLQHTPPLLSRQGDVDCAPREFSAWALTLGNDGVVRETLLVRRTAFNPESAQFASWAAVFQAGPAASERIDAVRFDIHSTQRPPAMPSAPQFVCLYRLRVFGVVR